MRCFVAIELPAAVRAALDEAQARLRAAAPRADVRWVDPATMHLTLKFLGGVPDDVVGAVRAIVAARAAARRPIPLVCAGLGVFPGPARPRVFWAGVRGEVAELGRLAAELERALEPLGFPLDARPFRGHVTLGRAPTTRGVQRITTAIAEADAAEYGAWTATEVVLFQSRLHPAGARYEALARLPLGPDVG